jgi:hypothetical protein
MQRPPTVFSLSLGLLTAVLLGSAQLSAQSNLRPGTDVQLGRLPALVSLQHQGTYPDGDHSFAMSTTACNIGSVDVPWLAAMADDHPYIAFLLVREDAERMVQISDRSYLKHGFFALSSSDCTPCQNPSNGDFLGVGCSDTYSTFNNGDNQWLAPADEIDPWLGLWEPLCSHFDRGEPPQPVPLDCDGVKSPIQVQGLGHRVKVRDAELQVAGATFYFCAQYVIRGEPENVRFNNLGSRRFVPTWNGNSWDVAIPGVGNSIQRRSVLRRWVGAFVKGSANGAEDGRVFCGVKSTDLGGGWYHYEYALHNRDNARGVGALRIPLCPGAQIQNVGFRDLDGDPATDWQVQQSGNELIFSTPDHPLRWNGIYNFWFDCDAASAPSLVQLDAFDPGAGAPALLVESQAPLGVLQGTDLGFGLAGQHGWIPHLSVCGGLQPGQVGQVLLRRAAAHKPAILALGWQQNPVDLFGGLLVPQPLAALCFFTTDATGSVTFSVPGLAGPLDFYLQYLVADPDAPEGMSFSNALALSL